MNRLSAKEAAINRRLKRLRADYAIANLHLADATSGRYDFDIVKSFKPVHRAEIQAAFREVLGGETPSREAKVATKVTLPRSAHSKLKLLQARTGRSQSEIVAQLIRDA